MPANRNEKGDSPMKRRGGRRRKKVCVFCVDKENKGIDYKDVNKLKRYVSERGKILPEESQETVQNIRELLLLLLREQDTSL